MINPKLTLTSVIDEGPTCKGVLGCQSFTGSALTPAKKLILDKACILDVHGLTAICHTSEDWPASI
jgi:hypothetical protein